MCGLETGQRCSLWGGALAGDTLAAEAGIRLGMRGKCGDKRELCLRGPVLNPGSAPLALGGLLWASVSSPGKLEGQAVRSPRSLQLP